MGGRSGGLHRAPTTEMIATFEWVGAHRAAAQWLRARSSSPVAQCPLIKYQKTRKRGLAGATGASGPDPNVWTGGALQEKSVSDGVIWSRTNVSGLWVELIWLLAIMEISAHATSLADRPRTGCWGHQFSRAPGRPLLHLFLSLSQTSVANACPTLLAELHIVVGIRSPSIKWNQGRPGRHEDKMSTLPVAEPW
jgi:hypothetical protein